MRDRLGTIQHLRGIACLMVAIAHCLIHVAVLEGRGGADGRHRAVMDGTSAIFFFVISGFIMVHVSGRYGTLSGAWQFLTRRFLRIAPLYYLCTFAMVVLVAVDRGLAAVNLTDLFLSLAFIPYAMGEHRFAAFLIVGWTLSYEMFYYVLFAIALLMAKPKAIVFLVCAFCGLVLAGAIFQPQASAPAAWTSPVILLFLAGCMIGYAWKHYRAHWPVLSPRLGYSLITLILVAQVVAFNLGASDGLSHIEFRPFDWVPALLTVVIAVSTREVSRETLATRTLGALGDSSYSLYLSHPLTIIAVMVFWNRLPFEPPAWVFAVISIPAVIVGGWVVYVLAERPLVKLLLSKPKAHAPLALPA